MRYLLLLVLMAGCATRQIEKPLPPGVARSGVMLVQEVTAKQAARLERAKQSTDEQRANTEKRLRRTVPSSTPIPADDLLKMLGVDGLGPPMYGIDMRWGKCEEHGEWWALGGRIVGATVTDYFTRAIVLICPRGHYIEREIEGPKVKP